MLNFREFKYTNKYSVFKRKTFDWTFRSLIAVSLLLIFFIFLVVYMYPTKPHPITGTTTLFFGFYNVSVENAVYVGTYINWMSIFFSILAIIYVIAECAFYWIYWNTEWSRYVKNAQLSAFLILSGFIIVAGVVLGFINSPDFDFSKVDFNNGLVATTLQEGKLDYNFIYYCHYVRDVAGKVIYSRYYLSEYGILSVVVIVCLILSLLVNIIFIKAKRN